MYKHFHTRESGFRLWLTKIYFVVYILTLKQTFMTYFFVSGFVSQTFTFYFIYVINYDFVSFLMQKSGKKNELYREY